MSEFDSIPDTVEEFLEILSEFDEFHNMAELLHNPNYHPEGDSSPCQQALAKSPSS